jgi:putative ABC transport system permease protein
VAPAMRSVFHEIAPDYALDDFQTMQHAVDQSNFSSRMGLYLTGAFAGMAVLMVIAGLYGVLAQLVSYRRREFGIRLALGATPGGILGLVLRQGLVFVAVGLAIGIVIAVFTGNLVKSFLYQVKPADVWTYGSVALLLLFVGSLAALIPARRAAAVEPMAALRDE